MHNIPDFLRLPSEMQEHFAKGGMIKRADGSYSRRGLWDNIRANKGSGRKPTKEMLEQEAKIRAKEQYGGKVDEYGNGGYIVRRSNARKGKTHVVIGPDGTKKYFGDSKLGQHPNDPARKKAFYARHKHNLAHNPYFRAFARATWKDGGEIPEFAYGAFYSGTEAKKMQGMFTPSADSMTPSFANGGLTKYQDAGEVDYNAELAKWKQEHGQPTYSTNGYLEQYGAPKNNQLVYNAPAGTTFGRTVQAPAPVSTPQQVIAPVVAQEPVGLSPNVERMGLMSTRAISIPSIGPRTAGSIPTSLMKKDVIKPSAPLKTNNVPKTVQDYFDTYSENIDKEHRDERTVGSYNIVDQSTGKLYVRSFDPSYKGGFKITGYPFTEEYLAQIAKIPGTTKNTDPFFSSNTQDNTLWQDSLQCTDGQHHGGCPDFKRIRYSTNGIINGFGDELIPEMNTSMQFGTLVINSDKSMEENEKKRLEVAKKNLPSTINSLIPRSNDNEFINDPSLGNPREVLYHIDLQNPHKIIAGQSEEYLQNNPMAIYGTEDQKKIYDYEQMLAEEQNKKRNGGKIYRRGGSIRRFDVGGENQVVLNQQQPGVYNLGQMGPGDQGNYQPNNYTTNIGEQQAGNYNIGQQGPAQTVPQTANSGQGINTTTPTATPAIANAAIATPAATPISTPSATQTSSIIDDRTNLTSGLKQNATSFNNNPFIQGSMQNAQNITNDLNSTNTDNGAPGPVKNSIINPTQPTEPASLGEQTASRNQEYEDRMIGQYGIKRSDIDKRYEELRKQYPNSTNEDIYNTLNKEFGDQAKANEQDKAAKAELARRKSIAGVMKGASQAIDATFAGADILSRLNPNSSQNAVLNKNRENANPMNTMNIVGNRKGIEYAAYGGYTGLKEGVELNLSTQQIHELEKQGYKFQIL